MTIAFEFEKAIDSLEKKLRELEQLSETEGLDLSEEIHSLQSKLAKTLEETYTRLTPWQHVQVSRHPNRPYTLDYLEKCFEGFTEIAGDRAFGEDLSILTGTAYWRETADSGKIPVAIIGQQKGRTTKQRMERNFGMAKPEGYRKAIRTMEMAERFRMPLITFIDTPGAFPGMEAEERGQSQAIAETILKAFELTVPVISIVIGEGGSGGALAIGVANKVLMQQFSTYSVISPESCASILWSESTYAEKASEKLKMLPQDLTRLGIVDDVIKEPLGGAHRDWPMATDLMKKAIKKYLNPYLRDDFSSPESEAASRIREERFQKFREMGNGFVNGIKAKPKAESKAEMKAASKPGSKKSG